MRIKRSFLGFDYFCDNLVQPKHGFVHGLDLESSTFYRAPDPCPQTCRIPIPSFRPWRLCLHHSTDGGATCCKSAPSFLFPSSFLSNQGASDCGGGGGGGVARERRKKMEEGHSSFLLPPSYPHQEELVEELVGGGQPKTEEEEEEAMTWPLWFLLSGCGRYARIEGEKWQE